MNTTKERSCDGKKPYRTRRLAMFGLQHLNRFKDGERLQVYKCHFGEHFHVGHKKSKEIKHV